jgi:hypothetical protein
VSFSLLSFSERKIYLQLNDDFVKIKKSPLSSSLRFRVAGAKRLKGNVTSVTTGGLSLSFVSSLFSDTEKCLKL